VKKWLNVKIVPPTIDGRKFAEVLSLYLDLFLLLRPGRGAEYCDQFVCLCVCLSAGICRTVGPIFTKYCVQIPCSRGSVFFWRRCDMLCTSGFMDDVTFGRIGPYGHAWKAEPLI